MARTKIDKEKELREKLQQEAEAHIAQVKSAGERAVRRKARKIRKLYATVAVLSVLLIAGGVAGGLAYKNVKDENKRLSNPQESAKVETERIKKQVAALIDVPTDEEPTIANVADANKAKEQSPEFFAKAENGDRLLMYPKAKKAILYRPSTNRIIEVSTLNIGGNNTSENRKDEDNNQTAPEGTTEIPAGTEQQP